MTPVVEEGQNTSEAASSNRGRLDIKSGVVGL